MNTALRRRYYLAIAICAIDIALSAIAYHVHPDSWFAPVSMGLCIWIGAVCTNRLMKARKGGVQA